MRIFTALFALLALIPTAVIGQTPKTRAASGTQPSAEQRKLLAAIRTADKGQLAVSEEDGRFLRILVTSSNAKRVLEIGGASGYSGIWMGLGLRETGGRL